MKKFFALLVCALLLTSLLPVSAGAAVINDPDHYYCPNCGAEGYDPGGGTPATCTVAGFEEGYCPEEGYVSRVIPPLGHSWGRGVQIKEPTCTETGITRYTCMRVFVDYYNPTYATPCGAEKDEVIPALGHNWSPWEVMREPTPQQDGYRERYCCRQCGAVERQNIPYNATPTATVAPTKAPDDSYDPSLCDIVFRKSVISEPANGRYYVEGEEVTYSFTLTHYYTHRNDDQWNKEELEYWKDHPYIFASATASDLRIGKESLFSDLGSDFAEVGVSAGYIVTAEDVAAGQIENTATATYTLVGQEGTFTLQSNTVVVKTGREERNPRYAQPEIHKEVLSSPANGRYYVPGEVIRYAIPVTVPANDRMINPEVYDLLIDEEKPICYLEGIQKNGGAQILYAEYTVTEQDAEVGFVDNYAYLNWTDSYIGGDNAVFTEIVEVPAGPAEESVPPTLEIQKICTTNPKNGVFYTEDEAVGFDVIITNKGTEPASYITIWDTVTNSEAVLEDYEYLPYLEGGDFYIASFYYTVTCFDVAAGSLANTAGVVYHDKNNTRREAGPVYCSVPTGEEGTDYGLYLGKHLLNEPANGAYFVPGEEILFSVCMVNNGTKVLYDVAVYDMLNGLNPVGWANQLAPAESAADVLEFIYSYTVTEADAMNGWVANVAEGFGAMSRENGDGLWQTSNLVEVPTGFDTEGPMGFLFGAEVTKTVTSTPKNGAYYTLGEAIEFDITVTNEGESPFDKADVYDVLKRGTGIIGSADGLAPNASKTVHFTYNVTQADVDNGYVINVSTVAYYKGDCVFYKTSNLVGCYTGPEKGHIPGIPDDAPEGTPGSKVPDPSSTPGKPWIPGGATDSGTITGVGTGEGCKITLKEHSTGSWELLEEYCGSHNATRKTVEELMATANGSEAVYGMAKELWLADIEELYTAFQTIADPLASVTLLEERISFLTLVENTEALLTALYPNDAATVQQQVLSMLESKCNRLCYELHTQEGSRTDFFEMKLGKDDSLSPETCETQLTRAAASVLRSIRTCGDHTALDTTGHILLSTSTPQKAWTSSYRLWVVELQNTYNSLAAAMGPEALETVGSYYAALTANAEARERLLNARYEDSAAIHETMTGYIRDALTFACQHTPEPATEQSVRRLFLKNH